MLILAIDDEPKMLKLLHKAIEGAVPGTEIIDFSSGFDAIAFIEEHNNIPDIVFSDIRMPKLDGLELAVRIKKLAPYTRIVFVTGYDDYALNAYRLHASGYVLKPVDSNCILEEITHAFPDSESRNDKLKVRCFGRFEVFWNNQPVRFGRLQTKELFAYLIDLNGAQCTAAEAASVIWENESDTKVLSHRIRNLIADLRNSLEKIGQSEVLVRKGTTLSINCDLIECDYYQMLCGDMIAVNSYHGEYMSQYSWANMTEGNLYFRFFKKE